MKRVLMVCLGNICRSPAGEAILRTMASSSGCASMIDVDSAGVIDANIGRSPNRTMSAAAARRGYALAGQARRVTRADLDLFELIIAMDREVLTTVESMSERPRAAIRLLSDYLTDEWPIDVPDPYHGPAEEFEQVLDMLEAACPKIIDDLRTY